MEDKQKQIPATVSQIRNEKPSAPRTEAVLTGNIANSMNGGHNRTIQIKQVMAGERHKEMRVQLKISTLTPLTPAYQNLKCTIRSYFVPNSRVWINAEKFTSQRGGTTEDKITEVPNCVGKEIPKILNADGHYAVGLCHTSAWRNAWISSYIPRINEPATSILTRNWTMPDFNALILRGKVAIWNDYERNKELDTEEIEYKEDTVSQEEWESYLPINNARTYFINSRARKDNSYYTDYRTDYQGFYEPSPETDAQNPPAVNASNFVKWADWEAKIAEARSQAENAQKNDWEIISEIRGSKLLTEGKTQLIGKKTFNLNYAAITQSTYNTNSEIKEEFQVMGKQGAYSYTEVDLPVYAGMQFNEEGYVHIIATVTADTVYEGSFDRLDINVKALDQYRPDLQGEKFDILKTIETSTIANSGEAIGYKRKYSEYFKMKNTISGDLTTLPYYEFDINDYTRGRNVDLANQIITQYSYQFFETSSNVHINQDGTYIFKKNWKDYTDLQLNKNQAIQNEVVQETILLENGAITSPIIKGHNQIFLVGKSYCMADLPINSEIAPNYTQWGEH